MNKNLRIAVADDEPEMVDYFKEILPLMGHEVVITAASGRQLVEACRAARPDLVITDIRMPAMDGIDAASEIYRDGPVPVILVSAYHDPELIERAGSEHVLAYLVKPIKQAHLEPAITIAMRRFDEFKTLEKEAADLRQALLDRHPRIAGLGQLGLQRVDLGLQAALLLLQRLNALRRLSCPRFCLTDLLIQHAAFRLKQMIFLTKTHQTLPLGLQLRFSLHGVLLHL